MKKIVLMIILALSFGIVFISCDKEKNTSEIDGTYVGIYTTTGPYLLWSTAPTIKFKNGKFTSSGLSNGGYHDIGNGNFTIKGNKIIFELTHIAHDPSMPDVDLMLAAWHSDWLLNGEYEYKAEGNKLTFSKTTIVLGGKYRFEFKLERNKNEQQL